jgi:RNA polymerase sigma-70 factor (ECF subfamily)
MCPSGEETPDPAECDSRYNARPRFLAMKHDADGRRPDSPRSGETTYRLLARARDGDREALEHLFARCAPALKRWAAGRLPQSARDLSETQDLVQEALLQTFKKLDTFEARGPGALQAYLRQAVMNRIRDELRRSGRRAPHDVLETDIPAPAISPLEAAIGRNALDRYEHALARLKAEDREAVILRIELGYSYEEIAEMMSKPSLGATRKMLERAIVRLAAEMSRDQS